ncbi:MAG: biotin--[acetyl-CoA-carboxylase] ligase [Actinomycetota bacterium]|nr:biotin--[acetyl-CoA-carboxylase] ligase [Actinomycetota bacterium]
MDLLPALTDRFRSGEELAGELGVTRAAVWKAAHALADDGYPVEADRASGYRLRPGTPSPGALTPLLGGTFGHAYRYLGSTGSTQDDLRVWTSEGAPEGAVVLVERQEQGRGRRGRTWESASGTSLTFSLLLRPRIPVARLPLISLAAGVALADAVDVGTLRWPNDLLAPDGRKLAGILVESQTSGEDIDFVLVGIGLNVEPPTPGGAAAVSEFRPVARVELLAAILTRLEAVGETLAEPGRVVKDWTARSTMLGRPVRATTAQGELVGTAERLDADGSLVLKTAAGSRAVSAGDVELIREEGVAP